jgi:hypothetical protein
MTDLRPDIGEDEDVVGASKASTGISLWQKVVGAGGLVAVVWVGVDSPLYDAWFDEGSGGMNHGPGGGDMEGDMPDGMDHGPGGDTSEGDQSPDVDSGGDRSGSGGHDRTQGGHG